MILICAFLFLGLSHGFDSSAESDGGRQQRFYSSYPSSSSSDPSVLIPDSWFMPSYHQEYVQARQNHPALSSTWDFEARAYKDDSQQARTSLGLFPGIKKHIVKAPVKQQDKFKDDFDVTISNASLLVDVLNDLLAVRVTNDTGVYLRNASIPVEILNRQVNVNISNTPLPVVVQSRPGDLNATLVTDIWKDLLSNISAIRNGSALNVTVNNKDLNVTVQNDNFGVYLLNSSIPVSITNATLNVNITNTPLPVIVQRQADDLNGTTAERLLSELVSNITAIRDGSALNVTVNNKEFNVSIANIPLPVSITNQSLLVQFAPNTTLDVSLANSTLPVEITNGTLNVNVTNVPLPVLVVRQPGDVNGTLLAGIFKDIASNISAVTSVSAFNVSLNNKDLNVTISNRTLLVELANQTLKAELSPDSKLGVYVLNSSIPVGITNATLNVNITNTPLPVLVQRQPNDLNGTTAERLLSELLSNITAIQRGSPLNVTVSNATLNVTLQNQDTPLNVSIANQSLKVEFPTNSALGVYLLNSSIPVDIRNASLNVNIANTPLPVVVQRQPGDLNATALNELLQQILSNITALKNMGGSSGSSGYTPVCPPQLGDNGQDTKCRTMYVGSKSYCFCFVDTIQLNAADAKDFCSSLAPSGALLSTDVIPSTFLLQMARMMRIASVKNSNYLLETPTLTAPCGTFYSNGGTLSGAINTVSCTSTNQFVCQYPLG